jgi:hypothetical protein
MASAARTRVRDFFSVEHAVEKTLEVYDSMWRVERQVKPDLAANG